MPENIFLGPKLYPVLHFPGFQVKENNSYVQIFQTSYFKDSCSNLPGELILLKFYQNMTNR